MVQVFPATSPTNPFNSPFLPEKAGQTLSLLTEKKKKQSHD